MMNLRTFIWIIFIFLLVSQSACYADITYQGKVIDGDTLEPIEGALVVATWQKIRTVLITRTTEFKDAKETLTDENGEWSITGPEGYEDKIIPGLLSHIGVWATQRPVFLNYKPGYVTYWSSGCFIAYPYIDRKHNLEGIVFIRIGATKEEREKYRKKFGRRSPFIPVKDPEKKLRDLDFPFIYPENVKTVGWKRMTGVYNVVGLRKAETREERLDAMSFLFSGKELPLSSKMEREERERLFGADRKKK